MQKKSTNNEIFNELTQGFTQAEIVAIFNTPNDVGVKLSNVKNWLCLDPTKTHYRAMTPITLELFKYRMGLL